MITVVESIRPIAALACPFACSLLILMFRNKPNIREGCTLVAASLQFCIILSMAPIVLQNKLIVFHILTITPGIDLGFQVDAFGLLFAITSSFLWILVSIYSIGYMRALNEHAQTRFYFFFALAIFSAVSIAMSKNLITFYLFYEALTFSTYWLVAHHEDKEAFEGAKKYLTYLMFSGWFLFAAVVMTNFISHMPGATCSAALCVTTSTANRNEGINSKANIIKIILLIQILIFISSISSS